MCLTWDIGWPIAKNKPPGVKEIQTLLRVLPRYTLKPYGDNKRIANTYAICYARWELGDSNGKNL